MRIKRPFEFDITPSELKTGTHWVSVHLKNVSTDTLTQLDIKLYSRNQTFIDVWGTGTYTSEVKPGEERFFPFQIYANQTTKLYATVSGYREGIYFFWTSPNIEIYVGITTAKLRNVFALTHPYAVGGETLEAEAVVEGVTGGDNFLITFWHDSPSSFEKLGETKIEKLGPGEVKKSSIEFTPNESGRHEIHAYLYDDHRYIGTDSDVIWVE
jgi:hypothetical protein